MRILIIVDHFGWAFDFIARGIQKYSKYSDTIQVRQFWNLSEYNQPDVVFFLNASLLRSVKSSRYLVGIHSESISSDGVVEGFEHICIFTKLLKKFQKQYPNEKFHLIHNGVDPEIFYPKPKSHDNFIVGWAGNPRNPVKRFPLLRKLEFEVKAMGNWGPQRFRLNRNRRKMVDFYHDIDAYVCVSESEGMPLPILEAAACGLPIVSTDVGGIGEFVDADWLVPSKPAKIAISTINEKLKLLKEDEKLRCRVGQKNLTKALNKWSWEYIVRRYDRVFGG